MIQSLKEEAGIPLGIKMLIARQRLVSISRTIQIGKFENWNP